MRITVSSRVRLNHILKLLFLLHSHIVIHKDSYMSSTLFVFQDAGEGFHSIDDGKEDFFLMDVVESGYMCSM
jgi:hypothetical protein